MFNSRSFRILSLVVAPIVMAAVFWFVFSGSEDPVTDPTRGATNPSVQIGFPTDPTDPEFTLPTIGKDDTSIPTIPAIPTEPALPTEPTVPSEPVDPATPTAPAVPDTIPDDGSGLTPEEPEPTEPEPTKPQKPEKQPVEPETPVQPPVEDDKEETQGGISIGGGSVKYDCGTDGHHCDGPETHAYIMNLELKGCPYCGSHSCPSFYAVDEWGNTCYTPSQCPGYDIHEDPVHYCQRCGKACGDGTNGTCVQYVNACNCPSCGEHVDSRACHTCKEE